MATLRIILGIQLVNDFEVGTEDRSMEEKGTSNAVSIRALFALASMPSHSCVANATHDFAPRSDIIAKYFLGHKSNVCLQGGWLHDDDESGGEDSERNGYLPRVH